MALEDKVFNFPSISIEIKTIKSLAGLWSEKTEKFLDTLKFHDQTIVVKQDNKIKLIYGPVQESNFYFPQKKESKENREEGKKESNNGKKENIIMYFPEIKVELATIYTYVKPDLLLLESEIGSFKGMNLDNASGFIEHFKRGDRIMVVENGCETEFIYGPIEKEKLYLANK